MERINIKDLKYYEPLHKVHDILRPTKGINYVVIMADAHSIDETDKFPGGQIAHFEADDNGMMKSPNDMELIGNALQGILRESGMKYAQQVKWMNDLYSNVIRHITDGEYIDEFEPTKGEE